MGGKDNKELPVRAEEAEEDNGIPPTMETEEQSAGAEEAERKNTISSSSSDEEEPASSKHKGPVERDDKFPPKVNSEVEELAEGVTKQIITEGRGEKSPSRHSTCFLHYRAWAESTMHKFEDTWQEGGPFELVLGHEKKVLRGLSICVASMKTGETALFHVSYKLGYGEEGNFSFPNVPPKANLIYEVALVGFEEAKEGRPRGEMMVEERIEAADRRRVDGNEFFKENKFEEAIQQYEMYFESPQVCVAFLQCAAIPMDRSLFIHQKADTIGPVDKIQSPGVKTQSSCLVIQLFWGQSDKATSVDELVKSLLAEIFKVKTNVLYGKSSTTLALAYMGDDFMFQLFGKYKDMADAVKTPCHLNMAASLLKLERYDEAIGHCTIVLGEDPKNTKALFRRGKARAALGQTDTAKEDFQKVRKLAPDDKAVVRELRMIAEQDRELYVKQKELFKGLFPPVTEEKKPKLKEKVPWYIAIVQWFVSVFRYILGLVGLRKQNRTVKAD